VAFNVAAFDSKGICLHFSTAIVLVLIDPPAMAA
jgi:hypothetical protein